MIRQTLENIKKSILNVETIIKKGIKINFNKGNWISKILILACILRWIFDKVFSKKILSCI